MGVAMIDNSALEHVLREMRDRKLWRPDDTGWIWCVWGDARDFFAFVRARYWEHQKLELGSSLQLRKDAA
jgi:hypothetical protein